MDALVYQLLFLANLGLPYRCMQFCYVERTAYHKHAVKHVADVLK